MRDGAALELAGKLLGDLHRLVQVGAGDGEAQVCHPFDAEALHDHVDENPAGRDAFKNRRRESRRVGHLAHGHAGLRVVELHVVDRQVFHPLHTFEPGDDCRGVGRAAVRGGRRAVGLVGRGLIEFEHAVQRAERRQPLVLRHEHRDFDLAGGDHQDVDAGVGQGAEHPLGDTRHRA